MNYRQVTRKLRALGCEFDHQGKGSHELWIDRATNLEATVPNWGSKDLKPGTIAQILRDLDIDRRDSDRA